MPTQTAPSGRIKLFPGTWIVASVLTLIAVCYLNLWLGQPHNIEQLAKSYSSIYVFEKPPVVNHAGTLIGSMHTTDRGVGIFIADLKNKTEQKICEVKSMDFLNGHAVYNTDANQVFGWSPDDDTFAYCWDCTNYFMGNDGKRVTASVSTNGVKSFVWMTADRVAYIGDGQKLVMLRRVNESWSKAESWDLPITNGPPHAVFLSKSGKLAWLTDNIVWQLDFSSREINAIYSDFQKQIFSACYSKETDALLLVANIRNRRGDNTSTLVMISGETNVSVIKNLSGKELIFDAQWINRGSGYAYAKTDGENSSLFINLGSGASEQNYFAQGRVQNILCDGHDARIYVFGATNNEPPGFWEYNISSENANYALPPWGYKNLEPHFQPLLTVWAPFGNKHVHKYNLIPPINFSRQKKYPLIIAMDHYAWVGTAQATYAQCMANCGAFVALSDYHYNPRTVNSENVHDYTNILQGIYNQLAASPNVDTKRIYLFTASLASAAINDLAEQFPSRWDGVMLSSPIFIMNPNKDVTAKFVMAAGSDEEGYPSRFRRFQEGVLKYGRKMDWHIYPDEGHIEQSQNTMYEQACLMGKMIFSE